MSANFKKPICLYNITILENSSNVEVPVLFCTKTPVPQNSIYTILKTFPFKIRHLYSTIFPKITTFLRFHQNSVWYDKHNKPTIYLKFYSDLCNDTSFMIILSKEVITRQTSRNYRNNKGELIYEKRIAQQQHESVLETRLKDAYTKLDSLIKERFSVVSEDSVNENIYKVLKKALIHYIITFNKLPQHISIESNTDSGSVYNVNYLVSYVSTYVTGETLFKFHINKVKYNNHTIYYKNTSNNEHALNQPQLSLGKLAQLNSIYRRIKELETIKEFWFDIVETT